MEKNGCTITAACVLTLGVAIVRGAAIDLGPEGLVRQGASDAPVSRLRMLNSQRYDGVLPQFYCSAVMPIDSICGQAAQREMQTNDRRRAHCECDSSHS